MAVPVFISFDADHDGDLKNGLLEQAAREQSPLFIQDWSIERRIDNNWEAEAERRIARAAMVLVICGRNVHAAPGVTKEIQMAARLGKPVHLLDPGARGKSRPQGVSESAPYHPMTWKSLASLVHPNRTSW